ncbi:MAG: hypothetical protein NZ455_14570 [Bacteroidia bacterium]|nr:hypothetical protein [Bacteroidia bacterium]
MRNAPARAPARDTPKKVKLFFRLDIKYQSKSIYSRFNLVHTSKSIQKINTKQNKSSL